jgi:3'-phosphoadenosine 5'-phosphosulfate sulfotransferase (PAPS reductase)/FAD synthetase
MPTSAAPESKANDPHLARLEAEAIHILREAVAEAHDPVMLFSAGKDSTVLAHLALRAFAPCTPPFPLLHVDSTWEFRSLIEFRDAFARRHGFKLIVCRNEEGRAAGINPFDQGDRYTAAMRTEPLKRALDAGGYDVVFGGARRDEERSRAKERIVSVRNAGHSWDPRRQRPELWQLYNLSLAKGQSARVFPLSNWTETDVLRYALDRRIGCDSGPGRSCGPDASASGRSAAGRSPVPSRRMPPGLPPSWRKRCVRPNRNDKAGSAMAKTAARWNRKNAKATSDDARRPAP